MTSPTYQSDANVRPSVGIAGHGGMPGLPMTETNPEDERGGEMGEPSPPPRIGSLVDEVYHKAGAANDIVVVKALDGTLSVTDFSIMFNRKVRVKGGKPNAPGSLETTNKAVHVYVNGVLQAQLYMRVGTDGFCSFPYGGVQPLPETLAGGAGLHDGLNIIRFEIRYPRDARVLVAECFAFLWSVKTPVIVMDIDGTITRSDVPGLLMTLSPGILQDHTHSGICALLTKIASEGAEVMYLTSRPIALAPKTRAFLTSTKQDGVKLPLGPLQCCLAKVASVIWRELVSKNMHEYKMEALHALVKVFRQAGKPFGEPVFAAGIGNKFTDAVAYRAASIPPEFIFIIDKDSNLQVWDGDSSSLSGSSPGKPISPRRLESSSSSSTSSSMSLPSRPSRKRLGDLSTRLLFGTKFNGGTASSSSGTTTTFKPIGRSNNVTKNGGSGVSGGLEGKAELGFDSATFSGGSAKISTASAGESGSDDHPPPGSLVLPAFTPAAAAAASEAKRVSGTASPAPEDLGFVDDETTGAVLLTGEGESDETVTASSSQASAGATVMLPLTDEPKSTKMPAPGASRVGGSAPPAGGEGGMTALEADLGAKLVMGTSVRSEEGASATPTVPHTPMPGAAAGEGTAGEDGGKPAAAPEQKSPKSPSYTTYADERFFNRLRDSVKLARGEVVRVAREAGEQAAENAFVAAHLVAGENRESVSLKQRARTESVEHAEMRLTERVHTFGKLPEGHDGQQDEELDQGEVARDAEPASAAVGAGTVSGVKEVVPTVGRDSGIRRTDG